MPKGYFQRPADMGARISEGRSPGSVARKAQARELYLKGLPPKKIAEALDTPVSTIKNWVVGLPNHQTGFSLRKHGQRAARVARLTQREGEAIRQEMEAKENDPCVFCGSGDFSQKGWFSSAFHHHEDGTVDHAHMACNAVRRHAEP